MLAVARIDDDDPLPLIGQSRRQRVKFVDGPGETRQAHDRQRWRGALSVFAHMQSQAILRGDENTSSGIMAIGAACRFALWGGNIHRGGLM